MANSRKVRCGQAGNCWRSKVLGPCLGLGIPPRLRLPEGGDSGLDFRVALWLPEVEGAEVFF